MAGGQTIVTGFILVLVALALMIRGSFGAMVTTIAGSLPLILVVVGLGMLLLTWSDWRGRKAEAAAAAAPPATDTGGDS